MSVTYLKEAGRRARAYLAELLQIRAHARERRLPTTAQLARSCGVSKATMEAALRDMVAQGAIRTVPRGGIFAEPVPGGVFPNISVGHLHTSAASPEPRWQMIADDIAARITRGELEPGTLLPRLKQLRTRYGSSYRTLHRALSHLLSARRVERYGSHYRVFQIPRFTSSAAIAMVAGEEFIRNRGRDASRAGEILRYLERELVRTSITCLMMSFEEVLAADGGPLLQGSATAELGHRSLLGVLVQMSTIPHVSLDRFLAILARSSLPVAIVDETGYRTRALDVRAYPRMRVLGLATGEQAGRDVGAFLQGLGHRRVAYLSPAAHDHWCTSRLRGLVQTMGQEAVLACSVGRYWYDYALTDRTVRLGSPLERQMRAEARNKLRALNLYYPVDYLLPLPHTYPVFAGLLLHYLAPAFEEALADSAVTAWVAANDVVALAAHDWLRHRGVAVPQTVSLVGFDDSYQAFSREMTSYNFGARSFASAVLEYLVNPTAYNRHSPASSPEQFGFVVARQSVRQAIPGNQQPCYPFEQLRLPSSDPSA
jgi:DNA-binding transcriptional regulator YhcF (GntR family)